MKNIIYLIPLCIGAISSCCSQADINDPLKIIGVKGDIENLTESKYSANRENGEIIARELQKKTSYAFLKGNKLSKQSITNSCGKEIYSLEKSYDENGQCCKIIENREDFTEPIVKTLDKKSGCKFHLSVKDSSGEHKAEEYNCGNTFKYSSEKDGLKVVEKHNRAGYLIEQTEYRKGVVSFKETREYDKDNFLVKITTKRSDCPEDFVERFEYLNFDKNGNWTKAAVYQHDELEALLIREITYSDKQ